MTIDQILGFVFSLAAQFGIDNAIRVVIFIIIAGILLAWFIKRQG